MLSVFRVSAIVVALSLLLGCGLRISPSSTGGQLLPGATGLMRPLGHPYADDDYFLSISPDGKWLAYLVLHHVERDDATLGYVLYDLERLKAVAVGADHRAAQLLGGGFGPARVPCWSNDSSTITLRGDRASLKADVTRSNPAWVEVEPHPRASEAHTDCSPLLDASEHARVEQKSETRVRVIDKRERILASHTWSRIISDGVQILHLNLSPSGDAISYVVSEGTGSLSGPDRAFIVSLSGDPNPKLLLRGSVSGPALWSPDGNAVFVYTRDETEPKGLAIYRWKLEDL